MTETGWYEIPGYNGRYEISKGGDIRSTTLRHGERVILKQRSDPYHDNAVTVQLLRPNGKFHTVRVLGLMVRTFFGGYPKGKRAYHKDGHRWHNEVSNIAFGTQSEIAGKFATHARRRPVAKIDRDYNAVEFYASASAAAAANYMDKATVLSRCHNKIDRPFDATGYSFIFDDDLERMQNKHERHKQTDDFGC